VVAIPALLTRRSTSVATAAAAATGGGGDVEGEALDALEVDQFRASGGGVDLRPACDQLFREVASDTAVRAGDEGSGSREVHAATVEPDVNVRIKPEGQNDADR
jgi:hypothetical protein